MKKSYCLRCFIYIFASLLFLEFLFKINTFTFFDLSWIRIILFTATTSYLCAYLFTFFNTKISKPLTLIFIFISGLYTLLQLSFKNFMDNFMSINMLTGGGEASRLSNEIGTFISEIKFTYWLSFLPFLILLLLFVFWKKSLIYKKPNLKKSLLKLLILIIIHLVSLSTLYIPFLQKATQIKPNKELYLNPSLIDVSLREFGVQRFLARDIMSVFIKGEDNIIDIGGDNKPVEPERPNYSRTIDDSNWQEILNNTSDKTIKNLHQYYMNQTITQKNDYTGIFKDKNLIMIMVEALDMVAIDKDLTPTLYKMQQNGWYFNNYYAPKFSCTTGESEFVSLTSIIPDNTVCTPFTYSNNTYSTSIFNLFNDSNYKTTSYHSWSDQYYPRKVLHKNMGSSNYYNGDDLGVKTGPSWPSDLDLMKKSYEIFSKEEKYFSFVITVSMHFTYDRDTKIVTDNWDKVKNLDVPTTMKRYLAKAIEFDKAMEYLLKTLEEDGKSDDTVIAIFGDHHPYNLNFDYINDLSSVDRYQDLNEDLMPMIIYNSAQEPKQISKAASTFDLVPTLANLFDLNYDPRYYTGTDLFSNDQESIVIFPSGSWVTDNAIYFAGKGNYKALNEKATEEYISNINKKVSNKFTASDNTLKKDYFKYRFIK